MKPSTHILEDIKLWREYAKWYKKYVEKNIKFCKRIKPQPSIPIIKEISFDGFVEWLINIKYKIKV